MNYNRFLNNLGLCKRASKILIGYDEIFKKQTEVKLIIMTHSVSIKTQKEVNFIAQKNKIKIVVFEDYENELSQALGGNNIKIVGVTDNGFMKLLIKET